MADNTIYTASSTRHADKWRQARANGAPIIATWIDEAGPGETECFADLWTRCVDEARTAHAVILYREEGDFLKGALIETGAALGAGNPVYAVGFNNPESISTYSFLNHPLVHRCETLEIAFQMAGWNANG